MKTGKPVIGAILSMLLFVFIPISSAEQSFHVPELILLSPSGTIVAPGENITITAHVFDRGEYTVPDFINFTVLYDTLAIEINYSMVRKGVYTVMLSVPSNMTDTSIRIRCDTIVAGIPITEFLYFYLPVEKKTLHIHIDMKPSKDVYSPDDSVNLNLTAYYDGIEVNPSYNISFEGNIRHTGNGCYILDMPPNRGGEFKLIISARYNGVWKNITRYIKVIAIPIICRLYSHDGNSTLIFYSPQKMDSINITIHCDERTLQYTNTTPSRRYNITIGHIRNYVNWDAVCTGGGYIQYYSDIISIPVEKETFSATVKDGNTTINIPDMGDKAWIYIYNDSAIKYHGEVSAKNNLTFTHDYSYSSIIVDTFVNGSVSHYEGYIYPQKNTIKDNPVAMNISFSISSNMMDVNITIPGLQDHAYCGISFYPGMPDNANNGFNPWFIKSNYLSYGQCMETIPLKNGTFSSKVPIPDIFMDGENITLLVVLTKNGYYSPGSPYSMLVLHTGITTPFKEKKDMVPEDWPVPENDAEGNSMQSETIHTGIVIGIIVILILLTGIIILLIFIFRRERE